MAYYDRFDVCEAHYLIENFYNVGGILRERPSNTRRNMSTGYQLSRIKFRAAPSLGYDTLTENGREIFHELIERYNLPAWDDNPESETANGEYCPACDSYNEKALGALGCLVHYSCRSCGMMYSRSQ